MRLRAKRVDSPRKPALRCNSTGHAENVLHEQVSWERLEKRTRILQEFVSTEKTYLSCLRTLRESIMKPLDALLDSPGEFLTRSEFKLVFQNITEIIVCNSRIETSLSNRVERASFNQSTSMWCDVVLSVLKDKDLVLEQLYQTYINGYDIASKMISAKLRENQPFRVWVEGQLRGKNPNNLSSYLILPVQRLPRYIMLLGDLLKYTADDHPDIAHISEALHLIVAITENIDKGKAIYEQTIKKERIFNLFGATSKLLVPQLKLADELLEAEGVVSWQHGKTKARIHLIVLSNYIIGAKPKRNGELKYLWDIEVAGSSVTVRPARDQQPGTIHILSLQRLYYLPFIRHDDYLLSPCDGTDHDWSFWESTLSQLYKRSTQLYSLARRAWVTKSHMSRVLLADGQWDYLSGGGDILNLPAGHVLLQQGEASSHFYIIHAGEVSVVKEVLGGEHIIATLRQGNFLGDIGFLSGEPSFPASATIRCATQVCLVKISYPRLTEALRENVDCCWRFYFLLCVEMSYRTIRLDPATVAGKITSVKDCQDDSLLMREPSKSHSWSDKLDFLESEARPRPVRKIVKHLVLEFGEKPLEEFPCKYSLQANGSLISVLLLIYSGGIRLYRPMVFGKKFNLLIPGEAIVSVIAPTPMLLEIQYNRTCKDKDQAEPVLAFVAVAFKSSELAERCRSLLDQFVNSPSTSIKYAVHSSLDSNPELDKVFSKETTYVRRDEILTQGVLSNEVFQLVSGLCKVQINRKTVGTIHEGEIFGELGFLLCTVSSASVIVASDSAVVARCSWSSLSDIVAKHPVQASWFYKFLAKKLSLRFVTREDKLVRRSERKQMKQLPPRSSSSDPL